MSHRLEFEIGESIELTEELKEYACKEGGYTDSKVLSASVYALDVTDDNLPYNIGFVYEDDAGQTFDDTLWCPAAIVGDTDFEGFKDDSWVENLEFGEDDEVWVRYDGEYVQGRVFNIDHDDEGAPYYISVDGNTRWYSQEEVHANNPDAPVNPVPPPDPFWENF